MIIQLTQETSVMAVPVLLMTTAHQTLVKMEIVSHVCIPQLLPIFVMDKSVLRILSVFQLHVLALLAQCALKLDLLFAMDWLAQLMPTVPLTLA